MAAALEVPYVELDEIFHLPGWQELGRDELRHRLDEVTASDGWVADGNDREAVVDGRRRRCIVGV